MHTFLLEFASDILFLYLDLSWCLQYPEVIKLQYFAKELEKELLGWNLSIWIASVSNHT
jgi:hypothetical protein